MVTNWPSTLVPKNIMAALPLSRASTSSTTGNVLGSSAVIFTVIALLPAGLTTMVRDTIASKSVRPSARLRYRCGLTVAGCITPARIAASFLSATYTLEAASTPITANTAANTKSGKRLIKRSLFQQKTLAHELGSASSLRQ
jgi:hypothetical protein